MTFVPSKGPPPDDSLPVAWIDWCDAKAYCEASGKRLCGAAGGDPLPLPPPQDPTKGEWLNVCTNGGTTLFPYGNDFEPGRCDTSSDGTLTPVGVNRQCTGTKSPYSSVYDMNGNVWEWENSCGSQNGPDDGCRLRGGSIQNGVASCTTDNIRRRDLTAPSSGMRCCASHLR